MAAQPDSLFRPGSRHDGIRMSIEEYEQLEEEKPYLEYWDGIVVQKGVPKEGHFLVADEVQAALRDYRRKFGGKSGPEGHIWFEGRGYRVPDVVYWAPGWPMKHENHLLPCSVAVEIRSISKSLRSQRRKCEEMCAEGVGECWLIDPEERWVEIITADSDAVRLPDDGVITSQRLPEFSPPVVDIWVELDS